MTQVAQDNQDQSVSPAQSKIMQFNSQPKPKPKSQAQIDDKAESKSKSDQPPVVPTGTEIVNENIEDNTEDEEKSPSEVSKVAEAISEFAANRKAVGGLAIAVVVLLLTIWLLVPTSSGYTRAQLLWFTILGETKLVTSQDQIIGSKIVQGVAPPNVTPLPQQQQQPPVQPSPPGLDQVDFGF